MEQLRFYTYKISYFYFQFQPWSTNISSEIHCIVFLTSIFFTNQLLTEFIFSNISIFFLSRLSIHEYPNIGNENKLGAPPYVNTLAMGGDFHWKKRYRRVMW